MEQRARTAVVVVSFGSHALLQRNLAAFGRSSGHTVVVVDNRSTDAERVAVELLAAAAGWDLLAPVTNLGFGAGANLGLMRAADLGCSVAVLVNPDVVIDAATVDALADVVDRDAQAIACPRLLRPDGTVWFRGARVDVSGGRTVSADGTDPSIREPWLTGAVLAVDLARWRSFGGFDEDYFLYWEDVDLSWRWRRAGGTLRYCPELVAVHDAGGTQPGRGKSAIYIELNCRNRLVFAGKHLGPDDLRRWVRGTPAYALEVMLRNGRRSLLRPWSPLRAAGRGSWAGLRFARAALRSSRAEGPTAVPA